MSFEISHATVERYEPIEPPDHRLEEAFMDFGNELADEICNYTRYLSGASLEEFRALDFSKKIDKMCWIYGQNEYTRDKSIHIKSLKILKGIGDHMFHGDHSEPRSYHLGYDNDDYWAGVDSELQNSFQTLVAANEGTETYTPRGDRTAELNQIHTEYSWKVLGFSIEKRIYFSEETPIHAVYELTKFTAASENELA